MDAEQNSGFVTRDEVEEGSLNEGLFALLDGYGQPLLIALQHIAHTGHKVVTLNIVVDPRDPDGLQVEYKASPLGSQKLDG